MLLFRRSRFCILLPRPRNVYSPRTREFSEQMILNFGRGRGNMRKEKKHDSNAYIPLQSDFQGVWVQEVQRYIQRLHSGRAKTAEGPGGSKMRERERETYCSHHQRGSWTCGDHRCKWTCCCWRAASAGTAQLSYWSSRWKLCTLRVHLRRLPRSCKWEIVPPSDSPAQKDLMTRKDLEDARKWSPLEHPRPHSQF